jgi:type IV pilus assembly protein PilB
MSQIGQTLLDRGFISQEQLQQALERQRTTGRRLGETLVEMNAISADDLATVLADHLGVPYVDLRAQPPDPMLMSLIPEEIARKMSALAVARWGDRLVIAMAHPNDVLAVDDLRLVTGQPIIAALADADHLLRLIDRTYQSSDVATTIDDARSDYELAEDVPVAIDEVGDGPVVKLVNTLLEQAVRDHASDLHVEPDADSVTIRFRIDGVLHDVSDLPLSLLRPLVSRIKVLGGLDIAQSRQPQDGRFSLTMPTGALDVRVATVPTAAGESVVLRLLDPARGVMDLAQLGLSNDEQARLIPAFHAPQGAIVVTGPTGSGKSTTLYTMLSAISTREKSIVSVEDPVEYRVNGVKQIQINMRAGMTFPVALRSILRADPDIIFVGEIRDGETAHIAADASITGHLVLSTLHTTRAAATPMRLIDMAVEPYLVASALTCVAAQRLVRRLCDRCAEPTPEVSEALLRDLGADESLLEGATVRVPVGCNECLRTGYRGRRPIYEIMPVTEGIARRIVERASTADIERLAVEEGMDTMRSAALRLVARGELAIEEMLRAIA